MLTGAKVINPQSGRRYQAFSPWPPYWYAAKVLCPADRAHKSRHTSLSRHLGAALALQTLASTSQAGASLN